MPHSIVNTIEQFLRSVHACNNANDQDLLDQFVAVRDGEAFAEIVRRHGPMVLGVAKRRLAHADAEDVFQNVFLNLARQARSVHGTTLAAWLHRVAIRVASQRHVSSSRDLVDVAKTDDDPFAEVAWRELRGVLDDELNRLPQSLRAPLVLCYLEANTRDEAAASLGWSLRTLERRLQRARAILQHRLSRRGVAPVALAAGALSASGLSANVPSCLERAIVDAALAQPAMSATAIGVSKFANLLHVAKSKAMVAALVVVMAAAGFYFCSAKPAVEPPRVKLDGDQFVSAEPMKSSEPASNVSEPPDTPLPDGAIRRFGTMAWRHNGEMVEAVLSRDGKTLATRNLKTLAVWDMETGRRKLYLPDCNFPQYFEPGTIEVAPDGTWVAHVAKGDGAVRVVDVAKGTERWSSRHPAQKKGRRQRESFFRRLAVSADGKELMVTNDPDVRILETSPGKEVRNLKLSARLVAVSPDGKVLATHKTFESFITFCDAKTGKEIARTDESLAEKGTQVGAARVEFSPDGKWLATNVNFAPQVRLWDAATGKLVKTLERPKGKDGRDDERLACIAFSRDSKTVLAGGFVTSGVRRWDIATGKEMTPLLGHWGTVNAVIATPDEKTAISVSNDSTIRHWDLATGKDKLSPRSANDCRAWSQLSPDGRTVVTCDASNRMQVWDVISGKWLTSVILEGEFAGFPSTFTPDGKYLLAFQREVSRTKGTPLVLIDTATWKISKRFKLPDMSEFLMEMKFVDSERLLISGREHCIFFDVKAEKVIWTINEQSMGLAIRPDRKAFAIATGKGITIRRMQDGMEQLIIPTKPNPDSLTPIPTRVDSLDFSPDGKWLAESRWDSGDIHVWNAHNGEERWCLKGHEQPSISSPRIRESVVAYSRDGHWLATGHNDATVRLWEMTTGQEVRRFVGHDANIACVQFTPDGRSLISSAGVEVLQWRVPTNTDSKSDPATLWKSLASEDAAVAYRAMWSLAGHGKKGIEFLEPKITPIPKVDKAMLTKMIADLDSQEFAVRDKATKWLTGHGTTVEKPLEEALSKKPSAEVVNRIEELLKQMKQPLKDSELQSRRGMQVVEWIGGEAGRAMLQKIASGEPMAQRTMEAAKSLRRIGNRERE